jgi:predicted Zn-dependent protease
MAHNLLHHADRLGKAARPLAQFGLGTGKVRALETEADRLAVMLVTDAGYDPKAGVNLLSRLAEARGATMDLTHPDLDRRRATINAAIEAVPHSR